MFRLRWRPAGPSACCGALPAVAFCAPGVPDCAAPRDPGTAYFSPDAPATASIPVSSPSCPAGSLCNEERVAGKACEAAAGRMLPLSSSAVSKQNVAIGLIGFGFNQVL